MSTKKEAQAKARKTRVRLPGHKVSIVELRPGDYGINVSPTLKEKRLPIETQTTRGRFRAVTVTEGGKQAAVLHLTPDKKGKGKQIVTVHEQNVHTLPDWAGRQVRAKTGISQRAIKKLGL